MARITKPTRKEKKLLRDNGLIPKNWYILDRNEKFLHIISKSGRQERMITIKATDLEK